MQHLTFHRKLCSSKLFTNKKVRSNPLTQYYFCVASRNFVVAGEQYRQNGQSSRGGPRFWWSTTVAMSLLSMRRFHVWKFPYKAFPMGNNPVQKHFLKLFSHCWERLLSVKGAKFQTTTTFYPIFLYFDKFSIHWKLDICDNSYKSSPNELSFQTFSSFSDFGAWWKTKIFAEWTKF